MITLFGITFLILLLTHAQTATYVVVKLAQGLLTLLTGGVLYLILAIAIKVWLGKDK